VALRYFLSLFKLPGEAQQIDRVLQAFADRWSEASRHGEPLYSISYVCAHMYTMQASRQGERGAGGGGGAWALSGDTAFILAFSIIMLNTDAHSEKIAPERKMNLEQFISNNRGIGDGGADLPRPMLEEVYAAIVGYEIAIEQREYLRAVAREGWLVKQGGRVKTWKKRWVVVSASVLYYFEEKKSAQFKGMVPLEDVIVRASAERPFAFTLELAHSKTGVIKSAKAAADGSMTQGKHSVFLFAAESADERAAWLRALNESILISRFAPPAGATGSAGSTPGRELSRRPAASAPRT
jgi:hypothetical protein